MPTYTQQDWDVFMLRQKLETQQLMIQALSNNFEGGTLRHQFYCDATETADRTLREIARA